MLKQRPIALTIAGSDSGGGAGIQADLKTFTALGVHGTTAITCLTAQNPRAVLAVQPATPAIVRRQLEALFAEVPPAAAKTGMLFSAPIIAEVARFWSAGRRPPLVVDPVMVSTSGAMLLKPDAARRLRRDLLPLAAILTPNLDEVEALLERKVRDPEAMRQAARDLAVEYGCAVLVKGGHLTGVREAMDIYYDPKTGVEQLLSAPFVRGVSTHGTGCTYSAAITAGLASGLDLARAVARAKQYITAAIASSCRIARHTTLGCPPLPARGGSGKARKG